MSASIYLLVGLLHAISTGVSAPRVTAYDVAPQAAPAERSEALPKVVVLATGGTIATQYDSVVGALDTALTGEQIVRAVPGLDQVARVDVEQVANTGSRDMTPAIWRALSRRANELLSSGDVTGVVVTHGTDTLEETAYFLDLTVTSEKPVVVVGAQRPTSTRMVPATFSTQCA